MTTVHFMCPFHKKCTSIKKDSTWLRLTRSINLLREWEREREREGEGEKYSVYWESYHTWAICSLPSVGAYAIKIVIWFLVITTFSHADIVTVIITAALVTSLSKTLGESLLQTGFMACCIWEERGHAVFGQKHGISDSRQLVWLASLKGTPFT